MKSIIGVLLLGLLILAGKFIFRALGIILFFKHLGEEMEEHSVNDIEVKEPDISGTSTDLKNHHQNLLGQITSGR